LQYADGTINNDDDPPQISVHTYTESIGSGQARQLAAALLEVADEIDGWVAR
jgi:hypothetical protein